MLSTVKTMPTPPSLWTDRPDHWLEAPAAEAATVPAVPTVPTSPAHRRRRRVPAVLAAIALLGTGGAAGALRPGSGSAPSLGAMPLDRYLAALAVAAAALALGGGLSGMAAIGADLSTATAASQPSEGEGGYDGAHAGGPRDACPTRDSEHRTAVLAQEP